MNISVREMVSDDIEYVVNYFLKAEADFLCGMGVEIDKLPFKDDWIKKIEKELKKPIAEKEFYYIIWLLDDIPVGHSNVNNIEYGDSATMHIHLWNNSSRKRGMGFSFLNLTIPYYFEELKLRKIFCEPYSKNIAPNRLLKKVGFEFIKEYETIPGWINFLQRVNRYELIRENFNR